MAPSLVRSTDDWRSGLPVLASRLALLRELTVEDVPALRTVLTGEDVTRFMSPAPRSVAGFERFVEWSQQGRREGTHLCFAIIPRGETAAVGLIQIRQLDAGFAAAEWGFALASVYWGTGVFVDAARLALDFAFGTIGVERLEARAAQQNGRGNGVLRKLGATQEAVLRRSLKTSRGWVDQVLWSLLKTDWREARWLSALSVHVH